MVDPLPLPPAQVPLTRQDGTGKSTQQGHEFLERLRKSVKTLVDTVNIFNGLNATQATALLDLFTSTLKGLVPGSGGGTTNFLRADGAWAAPPAPPSGGLTRITSVGAGTGTTLSITGLGGYKSLWVTFYGVSHNGTGGVTQTFQVAVSGNNGLTYGTPIAIPVNQTNTQSYTGSFFITNTDQTNNQAVTLGSIVQDTVSGSPPIDSSSRGPIDALQFTYSAGASFDAGTFVIYGLK